MAKRRLPIRISTLFNVGIALVFVAVAAVIIALVNHNMRQQALSEEEEG